MVEERAEAGPEAGEDADDDKDNTLEELPDKIDEILKVFTDLKLKTTDLFRI
jgi:hypothetical protein